MYKNRFLALSVIFVLLIGITGCGKKSAVNVNDDKVAGRDVAFNEMANKVSDSSDLPDWNGKKLQLRTWYALGSGGKKNYKSTQDVVTPEIERVTGVQYNAETSFENNGELMDAKIGKIIATADWPDVIISPDRGQLQKLIDANLVYDLSELFPKYCTNLVSNYTKGGLTGGLKSERKDGKMYYFYYTPSNGATKYLNPDIPINVLKREVAMPEPMPFVYVRDDILKTLYPKAKTQNEIEQMYVQKGDFTQEDILDVTFNTKDEFFKFLYDIKNLNLKEAGKDVYPIYTVSNVDNWGLLTALGGVFGYNMGGSADANYFTYWDKETKSVEYMFKQPFFKDVLKQWTKLIQDGVASKESLVDNRSSFEQKMNNGLYAVVYGFDTPNDKIIKTAGKNFRYRKVFLNIPFNDNKFLATESNQMNSFVAILKPNVKEADLPQILRYYDFCASEAGQKLAMWGPKSAGLFEEVNGKRVYKDKELEKCMVYDEKNKKDNFYNLKSSAWPGYPYFMANKFNPKYTYDMIREPSSASKFFSMGILKQPNLVRCVPPNIWEFDGFGIQGVQRFWKARTTFEESIIKIFVAQDDSAFESFYEDMINIATRTGMDDNTLVEINKAYKESINKDYMDAINK